MDKTKILATSGVKKAIFDRLCHQLEKISQQLSSKFFALSLYNGVPRPGCTVPCSSQTCPPIPTCFLQFRSQSLLLGKSQQLSTWHGQKEIFSSLLKRSLLQFIACFSHATWPVLDSSLPAFCSLLTWQHDK